MASRVRRALPALLIVAFVVRAAALWAADDAQLVLDEVGYLQRAEALLNGEGFVGSYQSWVRHPESPVLSQLPQYPGAYQPPGQTVFVAGALALGGGNVFAVKGFQVLLGTLMVWLIWAIGCRWFDEATGLAAGWLAALYPTLIAFTHYLWSETLFIALLLAALLTLSPGPLLPSARRCALGGVFWGLACLTRATLLPLLPFFLGWWIWRYRAQATAAWLRAAIVTATAVAIIIPWSVRSSRVEGGFVAIDTNAPLNLWRGNGPDAFAGRGSRQTAHYNWPFDAVPLSPVASRTPRRLVEEARAHFAPARPADLETQPADLETQPTDLDILAYASREARHAILSDPVGFATHIPTRLVDMWNPTSFLLRHVQIGAYPDLSPLMAILIQVAAVVGYLGVMALASAGIFMQRRRPETWLVLLIVGWFSAITAVSFGLTRFRLPLMPLLILMAAVAWVRLFPAAGKSARTATALASVSLALGLVACSPGDDAAPPNPPPAATSPADGPNVLFVVWDTVRSDRMGLYGHDAPTTPRLEAWAKDARVFDDAISTAGYTIPSHASMFTGLLPSEHCTHNGSPRLDDEIVTLAELMRDGGYRTYLYSENPNVTAGKNRNLAQGFETTQHPWSPDLSERAFDIVWDKLGDDAADAELKQRLTESRKRGDVSRWAIKAAGPLAGQALVEWLEAGDRNKPFFAFVNYMEAHRPYIAPRPYREKVMSPEDVEASYGVDRNWSAMWEYVFGLREFSDEEIRLTRATYDACVLELDDLFGNLIDALSAGGWLENTIVVVTSDHGEHLGEQHMLDHQYSVYEPVLRVPLILHYPAGVAPGRDPNPVSNFDVFPTLLALTGVEPPVGLDSAARSLLDPAEERGRLSEEPAASEIGIREVVKLHPSWDPEPHRSRLRAWSDGNWKYIWRSAGFPSLYDLETDPGESRNVVIRESARARALSGALEAFYAPRSQCVVAGSATPGEEMTDEERARLEALGYLEQNASD